MKLKVLAAAILLSFAISAPVLAAEEKVTLNFVNSDLESTLKAVTIITGKNFVIDPKLKGTVNIVSSQPVDRSLILPIVQSALRQQGITLVDNGTVVKVVAEADAKQQGSPVIIGGGKVGTGDKFVTQVYPLQYESANQLAQVLRPLLSPNSVIAAYQAGNVLVISDYAENLARINRMIEHIDHAPNSDIVAIPVKYAALQDVSQTIAKLMPEVVLQGTAAPVAVPEGVKRVLLVVDNRSSQILVSSESQVHIEKIRHIIEMLDQPGSSGSSMHVIYLRNSEATRLAGTLRGILTGQDSGSTGSNGLSGSGSTGSMTSSSSTTSSSSNTAASSATSGSTTQANTATNVKIDGTTVLIQADAVTNSLIVTAPDRIFNDIRSVVEKLDVRRAQVYIEAMIAEISVTKSGEAGVQWGGYGSNGNYTGALISSISTSTSNDLATLGSAYLAASGTLGTTSSSSSVTLPSGFNAVIAAGSFGAMVTALQSSTDANVLSTPTLQTLDNEEARIVVGYNVPIKTGTTISSSSTYSSVERQDIGIKLKIKPQISEGGAITLTVAQEVSDIDTTINTDSQGLALSTRSVETKVLVDDGQIVVLGGLIKDSLNNAESRVPLLSDIPLIGQLFRYRSRSHSKTNLMVFLHPIVLRDATDNNLLSNDRYEYIRRVQGSYASGRSTVLPDLPLVQLPSFDPANGKAPLNLEMTLPTTTKTAAPAVAKDQAKTDTPDTKRTEPAASDTPSTSTETPKAP
jgi:general secretion pathway protein D